MKFDGNYSGHSNSSKDDPLGIVCIAGNRVYVGSQAYASGEEINGWKILSINAALGEVRIEKGKDKKKIKLSP